MSCLWSSNKKNTFLLQSPTQNVKPQNVNLLYVAICRRTCLENPLKQLNAIFISTSVIITWETCRTKKHCRSPGYKPSSCQSPSLSSPSLPPPAVSSHSSSLQTSRLLIEDFIGQSKKAKYLGNSTTIVTAPLSLRGRFALRPTVSGRSTVRASSEVAEVQLSTVLSQRLWLTLPTIYCSSLTNSLSHGRQWP